MNPIEVDSGKCTGCGQCVVVCPHDCFSIEDGQSQVVRQNCFGCGHCLAGCPASAISLESLPDDLIFETFTELPGVTIPGEGGLAGLVQLMRSRRSIRHYTDQPVPLKFLRDLVRIGTTAPSGTNCQAWNFTILERRTDVMALGDGVARFFKKLNRKAKNPLLRTLVRVFGGDRLGRYYRSHYKTIQRGLDAWFGGGEDLLFHGATAVILVGGDKGASCPAEDALLATGQMLLGATQMGLGTCLIGFVVEALKHDPDLRRLVGIGEHEAVYAVVAVGYPDETYLQPAPRKEVQAKVLQIG